MNKSRRKNNNLSFLRMLLKKYMKDNDLSQVQISELLNKHESVISNYLNPEIDKSPFDSTIRKIAEKLNYKIAKKDGEWYLTGNDIHAETKEPQSTADLYLSDMVKELNALAEKVEDEQVASRIKQLTFEISNRFSKIMERNELLIANQLRIMNK